MTEQEKDIDSFKKALLEVDWTYQYADDAHVFRKGQAKYKEVAGFKQILCLKYPEKRDFINHLWEMKGIEE